MTNEKLQSSMSEDTTTDKLFGEENLLTNKIKLTKEIENIQKNYLYRKIWSFAWLIVILASITFIYMVNEYHKGFGWTIFFSISLIVGILGIIAIYGNNSSNQKLEEQKTLELSVIEDTMFANEISNVSQEERAVRQLSKSQIDLDKYYQLNYNHVNKIFKLGKNLLWLGNIIVLLTLFATMLRFESLDSIVFILGFASGILVDFTGAIFVMMYSKIIKSANMNQYGMLETNQAYLGNVLASQIKNEELREKTLSDMANKLISKEKKINFND
jgi:hypothetical protein